MITLAICLCFTGFYFLYGTSKRAELDSRQPFRKWIRKHENPAKLIGSALLLLSMMACIFSLGQASGFFSFLVILMTLASFQVLISPLRFFSTVSLVCIGIVSLFLELYIQ